MTKRAESTLIHIFLSTKANPSTRRAYATDLADFFGGNPSQEEETAFLSLDPTELARRLSSYRDHLRARRLSEATITRRMAALQSFITFAGRAGLTRFDGPAAEGVGRWLRSGRAEAAVKAPLLLDADTLQKLMQQPGGAELGHKQPATEEPSREGSSREEMETKTRGRDEQDAEELAIDASELRLRAQRDQAILRVLCEGALHRAQVCSLDVGHFLAAGPAPSALLLASEVPSIHVYEWTLSPELGNAIVAYLRLAGNGDRPDAPLFCTLSSRQGAAGERLTIDGIYYLVRFYGRQVGIQNPSPRLLRNSALSMILAAHQGNSHWAQQKLPHIPFSAWERIASLSKAQA